MSADDVYHCIRCDKEVGLDDIFFEIATGDITEPPNKYGIHASCLEDHHNATPKKPKKA